MSDFATLGMDVDSRGLTKGQRELRNLERQAGRTEKGVTKASALMSRGLVAVGAAAAAALGGRQLVRSVSKFEEGMSRVGAISRASTRDLEAMREVARDLGSTTEFSATQAADGLGFLAMAGFNARESIAALPQVLDLATASGLGLAQSADIASNVISGFGLAAEDAAVVADTLAAASSRANTDVGQLGQAMSTVAPIAASLDISVQDAAAAIGVLSDAGIQGARAGTAMRGVLASLAGPTDQARAAIESYGLAVEDVDPATNSLAEIMGRFEEVGLSAADAMTIFGREAASGGLALIDASDRVGDLAGELNAAEGAAGDMADTMRDNLGGDIKGLMSALEGLVLALGEAGLTAVLRGVVSIATNLVRAFSEMIELTSKAATAVGDFIGLTDNQDRMQRAIDNSTLAMGDQIVEVQKLSALTGEGNKLTLQSAKSFLEDATARRDQIRAMKEQQAQRLRETSGFNELNVEIGRARAELEELETVQLRAAETGKELPEGLTGSAEALAATYEAAEQRLAGLLSEQQTLKSELENIEYLDADQQAELARLKKEIADVEKGIELASDDVVTFGNKTVTATGLTDRLSESANSITMSKGVQGAIAMSKELGVSLQRALQMKGLMGGMPQGTDVFDPRDPRHDSDEFQLERIRQRMKEIAAETTIASSSMDVFSEATGSGGAAGAAGDLKDGLEETGDEAETLADKLNGQVKSAVGSVADAFGDFVARGFQDFKGFARSVIDTFKNMLSNMIAMAARNKIMMSFGFSGGGAASAAAGGMSQSQLLSAAGGVSPFAGKAGGGAAGGALGGIGAIAGAFGGGFGNAAGALFGSGGGLGTMFSSIGAQVGTAAATGTATSIAAAAGAVALPLLGVAAAVSLFVPKIKELDRGIRVTADGLETSVEQFRKIKKSRLFGLIKSRSTNYKMASDAVADPIRDALGEIQGDVLEAARVMGTGASAFEDFSYRFKLSLKGMSEEERLEAVNKEFAKMGNEFASLVPGFANMNSLLQSANAALKETFGLGRTRFEAEMLVAARRRGEITTTAPGPGASRPEDLIRLQSLDNTMKASDEKAEENNRILSRLLRIWEGFEIDGVPRGPVVE